MPKTKPTFSIVIPALNEAKYLPSLLDDLAKQSAKDFEVIIVDGSSEDKTVLKAKKFSDVLNLRIRVVKKRNVAHQRNVGGKMAKADWIIFMDADNRLPVSFLDGIRYQLAKNPEIDLFSTWATTNSQNKQDKAITNFLNLCLEVYTSFGKPQGFGAMIGIRKSVFNTNMFPEKERYLEDGYLLHQASTNGYTYKLLHYPRYDYSLRRIKKRGGIKLFLSVTQNQIRFLKGESMSDERVSQDYPMLGGSYYDQLQERELSMIANMSSFIKTATEQQRKELTKLVKRFFETED